MIHRQTLLSNLQTLLNELEADLLERSESADVPDVGRTLRAEYERAKVAGRTAQNYEDWRSDSITQMAAAWVLSCVFVRFLEDNRLIDPPTIAGPVVTGHSPLGETAQRENRLQRARDEHELYFRDHPHETDRHYLLAIFDELAKLPGTRDVFGQHNPLRELPNWLSGDAAGELLRFFQKIDANTGALLHDFTDPPSPPFGRGGTGGWDTRFLGDLYQDLSEAARKKYALLQTPEFVEEFILDRTLEPALNEFGLVFRADSKNPSSGSQPSTLNPQPFRMIDPACGSGHFLLGAFRRILDRWQRKDPGANVRDLVQRTLDSIYGVDINPFAIAIARFRLLIAALGACGIIRLKDSPAFAFNLVCGDSLLHVPLQVDRRRISKGQLEFGELLDQSEDAASRHAYLTEDLPKLKKFLAPGQYHCVVANPPYITPKDRHLNEQYRLRFPSCHMKYSLAVPFMEQLFRLAVRGSLVTSHWSLVTTKEANDQGLRTNDQRPMISDLRSAGFVGQITANSFMKREFGKKLIETFFPSVDLTHVIDTSGAYIPGHGTPTVILLGRNRPPVASTLRTVMGIRGEPSTPDDPARGLVWSAIGAQVDQPGSQSEFVSVGDSPRELFHKHPWSIGGGGAAELKELLEKNGAHKLNDFAETIGFASFPGLDDAFIMDRESLLRDGVPAEFVKQFVYGEVVRDYEIDSELVGLAPYDNNFNSVPLDAKASWGKHLWRYRTCLGGVVSFGGKTRLELGDQWWGWYRWVPEKYRTPLSIVFAFVASHNHFVLDRGGKVFNRSAPVIKLPREAREDDHLALLGFLNSSTSCFSLKQISHQKQLVGGDGVRVESRAVVPYEFAGTQMLTLPIPEAWKAGPLRERLLDLTRRLDRLASRLSVLTPQRAIESSLDSAAAMRETWQRFQDERRRVRSQMILLQEEIDFTVYAMWDFADRSLLSDKLDWPEVTLDAGDRPFDILRGRNEDKFQVPSGIPAEWPADLREVWQRRMDAISQSSELRLIEDPHYKRRWRGRQGLFNQTENQDELSTACIAWLTNRLESYFDGRMREITQRREGAKGEETIENLCAFAPLREVQLLSVAKLSDVARQDADFQQVGELYRDDPAFDVQKLVEELVTAESVPLLPVLRYKPSGLRKRAEWELTWEMQREEDHRAWNLELRKDGDEQYLSSKDQTLSTIPVPPKYTSSDFLKSDYWRLRGKLDVPKERWVSFPHCEGPDGTLVIAWAGYDHLQLARAISAYFVDIQERLGGRDDPRLVPLLAGLIELLPWLKQWHNAVDPEFDLPMGDYFEGFFQDEARHMGKTIEEVRAWSPPKGKASTKRRTLSKKDA